MQKISNEELINRKELQRLQEEFCTVVNVALYCVNAQGEEITEPSGPSGAQEILKKCLKDGTVREMLERVEEGSLEDMAVEELPEDSGQIASVAVRTEEGTAFCLIAISEEAGKDSAYFYYVLDFLRDASHTLMADKVLYVSAEAEKRRSSYATQEMSQNLQTLETMTKIVQLLDSSRAAEEVMNAWIGLVGEHLKVDTAQIMKLHSDREEMDVLCEWRNKGCVSFFDRTCNLPALPYLCTAKPLVISLDGQQNEYQREMEKAGLRAVMVFPVLAGEETDSVVLALNHRSRKSIWSMAEIKFAADAVRILQNILTRRMQQKYLEESAGALEAVLDHVGCAVYVEDSVSGEMLFANRSLQNIFAAELQNRTFAEFIRRGRSEGKPDGMYEVFHADQNSWYDLNYREISWMDGKRAVLYSLYDITDKKIYQRKIEQQAYTDFLTGLYNRMCCERDLARQIDEAKHNGGKGAILYLDLDDFKHINDGLGHQYGDILLKSISHSLKKINGIRNRCYRMGGDEFVIVILPEEYPKLEQIIEDIRQIFNRPWYLKDADYYCTMSMGIVTFPDGGDSVADLVKKADIAMYEAKKSGKNRLAWYQDGVDSASGRRLDMEKNMRDATVTGYKEFMVYYQPIINVEQGDERCVGAEALVRWNSEKLGFIPPAEFIPLAEYLGLINPIGNYVLREACEHCKIWNDSGYPDYKVNVNLSVVQLLQPDIVEMVERTLKETGVNPANLTLEVTESLAINDMERMREILNRIKTLGVKLALDDFGTGYSSLNHIREIPFDVIKVDQSFVKDLAGDAYSQSFVKMIAELGETIGVSICVEGIETKEQYQILQGMKVKYVQGYYFDRPMPRMDFEEKYILRSKKTIQGIAKRGQTM